MCDKFGYPNDSYLFRAESGEHVQVTPRGKAGGGNTYTISVDARGASPGVERDIKRGIKEALLEAGIKANEGRRTI